MKKINPKSETLSGYKVSAEMKKVWQVEIDILTEIDQICKKNNIKYILFDGTLLGAIRHKGFIPWDDDIDIAMLREDYEKFREIASKELKKPYFFQTSLNDDLFRGLGQVRNSETTAIMYNEFNRKANQGIFVDIFVVDKLPKSKLKQKIQRRRCRFMKSLLRFQKVYECHETHSAKQKIIRGILNVFFGIIGYKRFFCHYEKVCAKYNKTDSDEYNIVEYDYDGRVIRGEHLRETKDYDFEYAQFPGPKKAEEFLTDYFGNWQKFVVGGDDHGNMFFDTEKPYTEYLEMPVEEIRKIGEKKWLKKH